MSDNENVQTVSDYWSQPEISDPEGIQWVEVRRVAQNNNHRATGNSNVDWIEHSEQFLTHFAKPRYALSLGCGHGFLERLLIQRNICQQVDGIDVAQGAIETARQQAKNEGIDGLTYWVEDLNHPQLSEEKYDVVYAHASLHHVFQLEELFAQVKKALKPDGIFVIYEYIGPSQMQFPKWHLDLADKFIQVIPRTYRYMKRFQTIKEEAPRLRLSEMNRVDPSEGIRSQEIISLLAARFAFKYIRFFGGTLPLLVLNEIAGNIPENDATTDPIIELLITIDNFLVDSKVLPSYHAYIVCQNTAVEMIAQEQDSYNIPMRFQTAPTTYISRMATAENLEQIDQQQMRISRLESELAMIKGTKAWNLVQHWYRLKQGIFGRRVKAPSA